MTNVAGYGPSTRKGCYESLLFNGDEQKYEQWEIKFLGYMRLQKLSYDFENDH